MTATYLGDHKFGGTSWSFRPLPGVKNLAPTRAYCRPIPNRRCDPHPAPAPLQGSPVGPATFGWLRTSSICGRFEVPAQVPELFLDPLHVVYPAPVTW